MLVFAFKCPCPDKHILQKATHSAMIIPEQSKTWKASWAQQPWAEGEKCPRGLEQMAAWSQPTGFGADKPPFRDWMDMDSNLEHRSDVESS